MAVFGSAIRIFDAQTTKIVSVLLATEFENISWAGLSPDSGNIISVSTPKHYEGGNSSIQRLPQNSIIIRIWRAGAQVDQEDPSSDTSYWSYMSDGRILSPQGFVIWAPPDLRPYLKVNSSSHFNPFVSTADGIIDVGYKDLCIGDQWTECYIYED